VEEGGAAEGWRWVLNKMFGWWLAVILCDGADDDLFVDVDVDALDDVDAILKSYL